MKKSRLISILMLIILVLNTGFVIAEKTPGEEYDEGVKEGENFGYVEGISEALKLYQEGKKPSYVRPNYNDVTARYTAYLMGRSGDYKTGFVNGFYLGHSKGFNEIVNSDNGTGSVGKPPKVNYGDVLGLIYGELAAYEDYNKRKKSNWVKAIPNNSEIIKMFDLSMETSSYRSYFLKDFRNKFEDGYKSAYEKSLLKETTTSSENGLKDGETVGASLGEIYGIKDYYENKKMNYKTIMPMAYSIVKKYSLNMDSKEYKEAFLKGFNIGFKENYNKAYRNVNIEEKSLEDTIGYDNGYSVGIKKGEALANEDYSLGKISNWEKHRVSELEIIRFNKLLYQSSSYRESFISGYWAGLSEEYRKLYKDLNLEETVNSTVTRKIPIGGGSLASGDSKMLAEVSKGTYYDDIIITIDALINGNYKFDKKYIKASNFYDINVTNKSKNFNNSIPINISFEYYGGKNGGIYKLVNNNWYYINSKVEDGKITAKINPNTLNKDENIYAVFIDNSISSYFDVRGHWAKEEIQIYIRRGFISGYSDNTFKPDDYVTRGEFLRLINKIYNEELTSEIKDINNLDKSALTKPISYKELEAVMGKLFDKNDFHWYNTSAKMLYNKKIRSKSYDSLDNKITRGELIYMLYILNEWKY